MRNYEEYIQCVTQAELDRQREEFEALEASESDWPYSPEKVPDLRPSHLRTPHLRDGGKPF